MDEREAQLSQQHAEALNRWVQLDTRYKAALPPVFSGTQVPEPFIMTAEYLEDMDALEKEVEAAHLEERCAEDAYHAYLSAKRGRR